MRPRLAPVTQYRVVRIGFRAVNHGQRSHIVPSIQEPRLRTDLPRGSIRTRGGVETPDDLGRPRVGALAMRYHDDPFWSARMPPPRNETRSSGTLRASRENFVTLTA